MKVTRYTYDQLIVDDTPWIVSLLFLSGATLFSGGALYLVQSGRPWGFVLMLGSFVCLFMLYLFLRRTQLVLHRDEGWAALRKKSLTSREETRFALAHVLRAEVEEHHAKGPTWRTVLVAEMNGARRRFPLTLYFSNSNNHDRVAHLINEWLAGRMAIGSAVY